jgi:heme A synthase
MLLLGANGGITALGDTLYPATSLAEGLQQKFSPTAPLLVRLRLLHPLFAITVGVYLIAVGAYGQSRRSSALAKGWWRLLTGLYLMQLVAGASNVVLLAPVWLQLVHLLLSDLIWITLVLLVSTLLAQPAPFETAAREAEGTKNAWPESPGLT